MIDADSYRATMSGLTGAVAWESLGRLEHETGSSKQPARMPSISDVWNHWNVASCSSVLWAKISGPGAQTLSFWLIDSSREVWAVCDVSTIGGVGQLLTFQRCGGIVQNIDGCTVYCTEK